MAFDYNAYHAEYKKAKYDQVILRLGKGRAAELKEYAALQDKSVNALILDALRAQYGLNLKTPKDE